MNYEQAVKKVFAQCLSVLYLVIVSPTVIVADEVDAGVTGLVDLFATNTGSDRNVTAAYWGNNLSVGIDADFVGSTFKSSAFGAYYRTNLSQIDSVLVAGVNVDVDVDHENSYEIQAQYQINSSYGFAIGAADLPSDNQQLWFAKLMLSTQTSYGIFEFNPQVQTVNGTSRLGFHAVLYGRDYMLGAGHDGEQWRAVLGYVAPNNDRYLRPAGEIFQWDSDVGSIPGDTLLFINGTLRYSGSFLSNAARMGRILGAGGVSFDNPVSYLSLGWNRTPGIWEIGDLWNVRWVDNKTRELGRVKTFQTAVFPNHLTVRENKWDGLFLGFELETTAAASTQSALAGYFKRFEHYSIGVTAKRAVSEPALSVFVGFRRSL